MVIGPAHEIFVLIAYVQNNLEKMDPSDIERTYNIRKFY